MQVSDNAAPFQIDKRYLNPRFEGYKLKSNRVSIATLHFFDDSSNAFPAPDNLGWRESRYRATFNRLAPRPDGVIFIRGNRSIWHATTSTLRQLAVLDRIGPEYPQLIQVSPECCLVSDGSGDLFLLLDSGVLQKCQPSLPPFKLHYAKYKSGQIRALVSTLDQAYTLHHLCIDAEGNIETLWQTATETLPELIRFDQDGSTWVGLSSPLHQPEPKSSSSHLTFAYSWTQDEEACTLYFQDIVDRKDVQIVFSPMFLSINTPACKLSHQRLHAEIEPSSSTWTLERDQRLLVVHLEKKEANHKWLSLFEDAAAGPDETVSTGQVDRMASVLSHMTSTEQSPLYQTSTLLGEGTDVEIDSSQSSDQTYFSHIDQDGHCKTSRGPFEILSKPLPSWDSQDCSFVCKRDVDGLYYNPQWIHSSLYPALAYVLASKRSLQLQYIFHHLDRYCLAIDNKGNAWIFIPPSPGVKAEYADQLLIRLDESMGNILGCVFDETMGVVMLTDRGLMAIEGLP